MKSDDQILINYMRNRYTDERLSWLLAHAEAGKLSYGSCCCFIGIPTADHALEGAPLAHDERKWRHYWKASVDDFAERAEAAFYHLGANDEERRANLIPLIRAEFERRSSVTLSITETEQELEVIGV